MRTPTAARAAALLAAASAVLHGRSMADAAGWGFATVTAVMIAGCLYCAYELLTRDTVRAWVLVAVMNVAMIGVHLPMPAGHHHSGAGNVVSAGLPPATVVAAAEVLLAAAVLFVRTRGLAPTSGAACQSGRHDFGRATRPARAAGRSDDPGRGAAGT